MFKDATIVFDLDGTLVDTAPDLSNALNDVLPARWRLSRPLPRKGRSSRSAPISASS